MGVDSISSSYGLSFLQLKQNGADSSGSNAAASSAYQGNAQAAGAYSGTSDMLGTLSVAIKSAMDALGLSKNDRVTFASLHEARILLEEAFTAQVKDDLKKLGVDENIEFRLVTNNQGGVDVISTHADAEKIERYFRNNPEMVKKFQEIQALSNVEEARKARGDNVKAIRDRLQVESMVAWFADSGQGMQQMMQYEDMQAVYSAAGLNKIA